MCNAGCKRNLAQFGQAAGSQFVHHLRSMQFDGSWTDAKGLSDSLVVPPSTNPTRTSRSRGVRRAICALASSFRAAGRTAAWASARTTPSLSLSTASSLNKMKSTAPAFIAVTAAPAPAVASSSAMVGKAIERTARRGIESHPAPCGGRPGQSPTPGLARCRGRQRPYRRYGRDTRPGGPDARDCALQTPWR